MRVTRAAGLLVPVLIASLSFLPASRAEFLTFVRGGQVELPATIRGSEVELATPDGPRIFPRTAFRSIVAGGRLDDEWRERLATAEKDGSVEARFAAAWWALEHGLTPEAIATIRAADSLAGSSNHAALARANRMLERLATPQSDADLRALQPVLTGSNWVTLRGRHVVLLHQANAAEAANRLDVLDRVVETYYISLAAQGLELFVPDHRLVSVWFARQSDYIAFLHRVEAAPFSDTQGYYHPNFATVFAFDSRSTPNQIHSHQVLTRRRATTMHSSTEEVEIARQSLLLDLRWRSFDLGIAAHETVHQLVAASGLAARFDDFPNWLHEGFAAQFEVVRGGRWAGFGRVNDHRLPDWRSIQPAPELAPLLRDDGLTHGYHRDRYAESWALVYYLRKTHQAEFITFLNLLQAPRPGNQAVAGSIAFTSAFGIDLDTLQSDWRRFMRTQTTPLEDQTRPATLAKSSGVPKDDLAPY